MGGVGRHSNLARGGRGAPALRDEGRSGVTEPTSRHSQSAGTPLVVAVVLVYDRWDCLPRCLAALSASSYPNLRILVVDNGSAVPPPPAGAPPRAGGAGRPPPRAPGAARGR